MTRTRTNTAKRIRENAEAHAWYYALVMEIDKADKAEWAIVHTVFKMDSRLYVILLVDKNPAQLNYTATQRKLTGLVVRKQGMKTKWADGVIERAIS